MSCAEKVPPWWGGSAGRAPACRSDETKLEREVRSCPACACAGGEAFTRCLMFPWSLSKWTKWERCTLEHVGPKTPLPPCLARCHLSVPSDVLDLGNVTEKPPCTSSVLG